MSDAEQIAVATSAMMNTSGGVLEVQIDTGNLEPDRCCESTLKVFNSQLLRIIVAQENWIPNDFITRYVKECVQEQSRKIYLFVNKTSDLITHHTHAYMHESGEVKLITDHDVICRLLRECSCEGEDRCQHHRGRQPELTSALSDSNQLNTDTGLTLILRRQHFCRYYQLHDRPLTEVLSTQSVSNDIKQLLSALANTDGGSIFLGITCTDTPVLRGYTLGDISVEQLNECLSQIINGQAGANITIWSTVKPVHENWKLFYHPVSGSDVDSYVIEIRVRKCSGGMFCSMPLCFEVSHSGDILPMNQFAEWKKKMLLTYKPVLDKGGSAWEDHFTEEAITDANLPSEVEPQEDQASTRTTVQGKDFQTSQIFQWWLTDDEDVTTESLHFNHCCARELADDAMDIRKPFMFFPTVEAVMEQFENATDIHSALTEIGEKYRDDDGCGVIIEKMGHHLADELTYILNSDHLCDVIVLKANCRPSVISVMMTDCDKPGAEQYSRTLVCLLKKLCLLTYKHWCDSNTHLCFQRQLYYIGSGFESVVEEVNYPKEYLRPTTGTLDIVRHTLAGVLLHCQPLTDRFGDIMIRHLSFIQAKILWEKRSQVTVVEGKAGSGKSILALETIRRIKQHNDQAKITFLCRGRGLAEYIKYQTNLMHVHVDIKMVQIEKMEEITERYFSDYIHVFIDDAHALPLMGERNCQVLYHSLFSSLSKPNSHAYILLDPDMQDYRGCIPTNFSKEIQHMALKYRFIRRHDVRTKVLGKILRNSTRICQFLGVNLGDDMEELRNIRNLPQDGVYLYVIEDLVKTKESHHRYSDKHFQDDDDAISVITITDDEEEDDNEDNRDGVNSGDDSEADEEKEEEGKEENNDGHPIYKSPFSSEDMFNALEEKMNNIDTDDDATLKKLKMLLQDALKGTVYQEHEEEGSNGQKTEGTKGGKNYDSNDNNNDDDHVEEEEEEEEEEGEEGEEEKEGAEEEEDAIDDDNAVESDRDANSALKTNERVSLVSRLQDILGGTMYHARHVTILTDNTNEKICVQEILRCAEYPVQDATSFPVTHIVVDTLENFEGLDSPVILFVVPESWGSGYIGSLKYRLCIATRAISRLEFLVPWDPTGREQDMVDLRRAFRTEVNLQTE